MTSSDAPKGAIIGLVMLLMSGTLAWLSSPASLHIARASEGRVTATLGSQLFGLFTNSAERIEGVRSVSMVSGRLPGSDSDTPDRLVFQTAGGPVDLGRNQQLFARDFAEIDEFLKADAPAPGLTLSSISRGRRAPAIPLRPGDRGPDVPRRPRRRVGRRARGAGVILEVADGGLRAC